ncbi:hypothetical protein C8J56DRAFT_1101127 [Mycena floridula]|nr:hypothetical protein C8J56DRAFT_1101127 [Mycena floridula]
MSLAIQKAFENLDSDILKAPLYVLAENMDAESRKLNKIPDVSQNPLAFADHVAVTISTLSLVLAAAFAVLGATIIMLGTKTKQINSYGKQARRIINVSEEPRRPARPQSIYDDIPPPAWAPVASRMKKRENEVPSDKPPKAKPLVVRSAPAGLEAWGTQFGNHCSRQLIFHPKCSRISRRPSKTTEKGSKPFTPFVEVDIIVLDDDGNMVSQERRVSRTAVESSPSDIDVAPTKRKRLMRRAQPALVVSDDSDSDQSSDVAPKPKRKPKKVLPVSDDSDSEQPALNFAPRRHVPVVVDIEPSIEIPDSASISDIITPAYTNQMQHSGTSIYPFYSSIRPVHSPVARPRQLTPIRGGRAKPLVEAPSPAMTSDLSFDFDQFSLDENIPSFHAEPEFPVTPDKSSPRHSVKNIGCDPKDFLMQVDVEQ